MPAYVNTRYNDPKQPEDRIHVNLKVGSIKDEKKKSMLRTVYTPTEPREIRRGSIVSSSLKARYNSIASHVTPFYFSIVFRQLPAILPSNVGYTKETVSINSDKTLLFFFLPLCK